MWGTKGTFLSIFAIFRFKGEAFIRETEENWKNHVCDHKIVNFEAFLKIQKALGSA